MRDVHIHSHTDTHTQTELTPREITEKDKQQNGKAKSKHLFSAEGKYKMKEAKNANCSPLNHFQMVFGERTSVCMPVIFLLVFFFLFLIRWMLIDILFRNSYHTHTYTYKNSSLARRFLFGGMLHTQYFKCTSNQAIVAKYKHTHTYKIWPLAELAENRQLADMTPNAFVFLDFPPPLSLYIVVVWLRGYVVVMTIPDKQSVKLSKPCHCVWHTPFISDCQYSCIENDDWERKNTCSH